MAGVVFGPGGITTGKYGPVVNIGAGAAIPPGQWFVSGAFTLTVPNTSTSPPTTATISCPGGFVDSDGTNAVMTAAGTASQLGAQPPPTWPWPPPWPLGTHP